MLPSHRTSPLRLDPEIEAYIRRRSAGDVPPTESVPPSPLTEEQAPRVSADEVVPAPVEESAPPPPPPAPPPGPSPEDLYTQAAEQDRETMRGNVRGANLSRAAALYRGERVGPIAVEAPTGVRDFLERRKLSGKAMDPMTAANLELIRAKVEALRTGKPNEPAPAEWGAPAGMTIDRAIRLGYGKPPKALSPDDEPASKDEVEELAASGYRVWGGMTKGEYKRAKDRLWGADRAERTAVAAAGRSVEVADKKEQNKREAEKGEARATFGNDWTPDPTSPLLTNEPAKQSFLDSMSSVTEMEGLADELRSILKRGVGITSDAETKTRVRNLVAKMQLKQKDIDKLGVLSVTDVSEFLAPQLANATGWDATWKQWTGQFDPLVQLDQYLSNMRKQVRNKADRMAVKPTPSGAFARFWPAGGGAGQAPVPTKRPQRTINGETREWDGNAWIPVGGP